MTGGEKYYQQVLEDAMSDEQKALKKRQEHREESQSVLRIKAACAAAYNRYFGGGSQLAPVEDGYEFFNQLSANEGGRSWQ
jgi:hypothetical protein